MQLLAILQRILKGRNQLFPSFNSAHIQTSWSSTAKCTMHRPNWKRTVGESAAFVADDQPDSGAPRIDASANGPLRTKGSVQKLIPILLEGIGRAGKARRASIPARSVSEEQQSRRAQGPQPAGAWRRRAIGFVARSVEYRRGIHSLPCASHLARRRSRQNRK